MVENYQITGDGTQTIVASLSDLLRRNHNAPYTLKKQHGVVTGKSDELGNLTHFNFYWDNDGGFSATYYRPMPESELSDVLYQLFNEFSISAFIV